MKKQRDEAPEIDKNKTRHDKLKPDKARPKRDGKTWEGSADDPENGQKGEIIIKRNKQNCKEQKTRQQYNTTRQLE